MGQWRAGVKLEVNLSRSWRTKPLEAGGLSVSSWHTLCSPARNILFLSGSGLRKAQAKGSVGMSREDHREEDLGAISLGGTCKCRECR